MKQSYWAIKNRTHGEIENNYMSTTEGLSYYNVSSRVQNWYWRHIRL